MRSIYFLKLVGLIAIGFGTATGQTVGATPLDPALLKEAQIAFDQSEDHITKTDEMIIIDYRLRSNEPRFYRVDMTDNTNQSYLVAHGRGSDQDHDGFADTFSNIPDSKMTSLGRFVTGKTYYGRHGLSLKLHGLDPTNDKAEARAIVIHGAAYVHPDRKTMGRSWGCPALEQSVAQTMIPEIANGVFIYVVGQLPTPNG
jgi:hypothetical protein